MSARNRGCPKNYHTRQTHRSNRRFGVCFCGPGRELRRSSGINIPASAGPSNRGRRVERFTSRFIIKKISATGPSYMRRFGNIYCVHPMRWKRFVVSVTEYRQESKKRALRSRHSDDLLSAKGRIRGQFLATGAGLRFYLWISGGWA